MSAKSFAALVRQGLSESSFEKNEPIVPDFEAEDGLKPQADVQIEIAYDDSVNDTFYTRLVDSLESRGLKVDVCFEGTLNMEHRSDGTQTNHLSGMAETETDGIVNHVVNGIYLAEKQKPVPVRVIRPHDLVHENDKGTVLYLHPDDNHDQGKIITSDMKQYLSEEGYKVAQTPDELFVLIKDYRQ